MTSAVETLKTALADRYVIKSELGAGGMATVYLADDLKHQRNVAVKVLRPELAAVLGGDRFLNEIVVTANLQHPNILPLYDSGEADSFLYYVMPYVEGESLRDKLNRDMQLGVEETIEIAKSVAAALQYAHDRGVIHRDIKPENILMQSGQAMVADFGIALAVCKAGGQRLTETGLSLGTPAYMSPEQVSGDRDLDRRSDCYALACVLYEMLAGDPPFVASSAQAVIARHVTDAAPSITTVRPDLEPVVARAIAKALSKAPADRFDSVADFAAALSPVVEDAEPVTKSIAVLPFANMSADPENEYFSDGISEEIINALVQVPELKVAGRTSSFSFKGKEDDLRVIGDKLSVGMILEGSVRKAGNRVRITAQLIKVEDGYHLWSERYDRDMDDIFAVQDEIAQTIVKRLEIELGDQTGSLVRRSTENMEAYQVYLRGRHLLGLGRFSQSGFDVAIGAFQEAIALDPSYGLAYSGLAEAYFWFLWFGDSVAVETVPKARAAASKALELDDSIAEAHTMMGAVLMYFDLDLDGAEGEFCKALSLGGGLGVVHAWYSDVFAIRGQLDKAIAEARRGQTLEPLLFATNMQVLQNLLFAGHIDEARQEARKMEELFPDSFMSHIGLGKIAEVEGLAEETIGEYETAVELAAGHPLTVALLGSACMRLGQRERAEEMFRRVEEANDVREAPLELAIVHILREDNATAIRYLERAREISEPMLPVWRPWIEITGLELDPSVIAALQRMGLP